MSDDRGHDEYFLRVPAPTASREEPTRPSSPAPTPSRVGPTTILVLAAIGGVALTALLVSFLGPDSAAPTASSATAPALGVDSGTEIVEDGFRLWARRDDGTPVRWNPCEPIGWVLNPAGAPPTARVDLDEAIARVSVATGLEFTFLGTTTETPSRDRSLLQAERYGDRWAPVLFAWVAEGTTSLPLEGNERGAAVPVAASTPDGRLFVSGQVILNASATLNAGFDDRHTSWGATLLHELGHLVGLDHVDDRSQLMYPTAVFGTARYSPGDLRGLAAVGATGGCLDVPPAQDLEVDFSGFEH